LIAPGPRASAQRRREAAWRPKSSCLRGLWYLFIINAYGADMQVKDWQDVILVNMTHFPLRLRLWVRLFLNLANTVKSDLCELSGGLI
jgi:hypothetical protein